MNKRKTFTIISLTTLALAVIATAVTFAWFSWSTTSENETKIVTSMGAAKVFFDGGNNITGVKLKPTADKSNGIVKNITVKTNKDTAYKISFNLYLDIISLDNGLKHTSFRYQLYKGNTVVKEGNFSNPSTVECTTNSTNHIVLVNDETITTTKQEYKLYIWIDGTVDNPETMENKNFNFTLHADGQNAVIGETLVEHINNLYNPNYTTVNTDITYNMDTTNYLMNDRLGTMSVGANDGNIRYYGTPNNYIDIGDTEINSKGEEVPTLYRIIGLFKDIELTDGTKKDLIKVIRASSIGNYSWDQSPEDINGGSGINEWTQADLMKLLNPGYQEEIVGGSLYWNSGSGTCYGEDVVTCDFTSIGLNATARNKIQTVKWHLGGWNDYDVRVDILYNNEKKGTINENPNDEVVRKKQWIGEVALPYTSDHGYSYDLDKCKEVLRDYDYELCDGSWLESLMAILGWEHWFLTTNFSSSEYVWTTLEEYYAYYYARYEGGVLPTFYLKSDLGIVSGDGSKGNPYVVG